jgi:hypothetical protein
MIDYSFHFMLLAVAYSDRAAVSLDDETIFDIVRGAESRAARLAVTDDNTKAIISGLRADLRATALADA